MFDLCVALGSLPLVLPIGFACWILARVSTGQGLFKQIRIGQCGRPFEILKICTMRVDGDSSPITLYNDPRITRTGKMIRSLRLDELPQIVNIIRGEMSLVGPRPDVAGYADRLEGSNKIILTVKPGITGPATLAFASEAEMLRASSDPSSLNDDVIFPLKVDLNRSYIVSHSFRLDLCCIIATVTGRGRAKVVNRLLQDGDPELRYKLRRAGVGLSLPVDDVGNSGQH